MTKSYSEWMNSNFTSTSQYRKWMNLPEERATNTVPQSTYYRMPATEASAVNKWRTATTADVAQKIVDHIQSPITSPPKPAPVKAASTAKSFAERMAEARAKARAARETESVPSKANSTVKSVYNGEFDDGEDD